ncbi:MAG: MlaD family protein [Sphingomonadales bacterium]
MIVVVTLFLVARADFKKDYTYYEIHFDRPVSGLARAGEVRFNGLLVGEVREIAMDLEKLGDVVVTIRVYSGTPVTTDTVAELESMGFTGVSFIQLIEDDLDNKPGAPLAVPEGEDYAVIRTRGGRGVAAKSAPEILAATMRTLDAAARYMSDENIARMSATLDEIQQASGAHARDGAGYRQRILGARRQMEDLNRAVADWEAMSGEQLPARIAGLRETAKELEQLSVDLDAAVTGKRKEFGGLASGTLPEITVFATELRRSAASFNAMLERIENDRVELLFAPDPPTVELRKE